MLLGEHTQHPAETEGCRALSESSQQWAAVVVALVRRQPPASVVLAGLEDLVGLSLSMGSKEAVGTGWLRQVVRQLERKAAVRREGDMGQQLFLVALSQARPPVVVAVVQELRDLLARPIPVRREG